MVFYRDIMFLQGLNDLIILSIEFQGQFVDANLRQISSCYETTAQFSYDPESTNSSPVWERFSGLDRMRLIRFEL